MMTITESQSIAHELAEKNEVIAHLTKTLAHTRDCLEIARGALERIAQSQSADTPEMRAVQREIARDALQRI